MTMMSAKEVIAGLREKKKALEAQIEAVKNKLIGIRDDEIASTKNEIALAHELLKILGVEE